MPKILKFNHKIIQIAYFDLKIMLALIFLVFLMLFLLNFLRKLWRQPLYERGLVIGKFYPPHQGHNYLLSTALCNCRHLAIIVCQRPGEVPAGDLRLELLQKIHGSSRNFHSIHLIDDEYDQDDSELWARLCIDWLKPVFKVKTPLIQVVFTSESYGDPFCFYLSKYLGVTVKHWAVDIRRNKVPISGTKIRKEPYQYLGFLHEIVRNYYIKRVVLVGMNRESAQKVVKSLETATFIDSEPSENLYQKLLDSGLQLYNPTSNPNPLVISTEDPLTLALRSKTPSDLTVYRSYARQLHSITYLVPRTEAPMLSQMTEMNIPNVHPVNDSPQEIITHISTQILHK